MLVSHHALRGAGLRVPDVMGLTWELSFQREAGKGRMYLVGADEESCHSRNVCGPRKLSIEIIQSQV